MTSCSSHSLLKGFHSPQRHAVHALHLPPASAPHSPAGLLWSLCSLALPSHLNFPFQLVGSVLRSLSVLPAFVHQHLVLQRPFPDAHLLTLLSKVQLRCPFCPQTFPIPATRHATSSLCPTNLTHFLTGSAQTPGCHKTHNSSVHHPPNQSASEGCQILFSQVRNKRTKQNEQANPSIYHPGLIF